MGLGKTACVLVALRERHLPLLVVCPASVRMVWEAEVAKWRPDLSVVVIANGKQKPVPADITVVSYELSHRVKMATPAVVVFDELHYLQNRNARRTKWAAAAVEVVGRCWMLSGTPMFRSPRSLWAPMGMLGLLPPKYLSSYERYAYTFCGAYFLRAQRRFDDRGASNLPHLRRLLEPGMFRVEKSVLRLPPKVRQVVRLNAQVSDAEHGLTLRDLKKRNLVAGPVATAIKDTGLLKVQAAVAHIKDLLQVEDKLVLFAWNTDVLDALARELHGYGVAMIDGRTSDSNRRAAVAGFQEGPARVFLGQIVAAGTGLTLTKASVAVFVQQDWTATTCLQAEDRVHRISQERPVLIQYMVTKGSIEENQVIGMVEQMDYHDAVVAKKGAE